MYYTTPHNKTVAAIGAMTTAMKAQRALQAEGIFAEIVALSPKQTRRGCAYGIEFYAQDERTVRVALAAVRITPSQFINKGSTL